MLGEALKGVRREGVEIMTKAFFPTGPGKNDRGLSRKHVMESISGSPSRLQMDYVDVYQAHRYDYETPLEETMGAFADIVHAGKAHYIGVSEWTVEEIRASAALAAQLGIRLVSSQPQYNMLWRVIEPEVVPVCEELGITQVCWFRRRAGVLGSQEAGDWIISGPRPRGGAVLERKLGLMLKPCAEFIFSWRPGTRPGYGDRGRSGRCASELVKDRGREASGSAGEESQDQG